MADITLKLVWYRLQETVGNMADTAGRFFDLSKWDLLDILFAGWILTPLCMYFLINLCIRLCRNVEIGRLPEQDIKVKSNGQVPKADPSALTGKQSTDQCLWINPVLTWLYLHYNTTPQILDGWLRSLNEYCDKLQNDLQPRFGTVQPGSLPPKVLNVRSEPGPGEKLSVNAVIDCRELEMSFYVTPLRRFEEIGFKLRFQKIHGEVCFQASCYNDEVQASAAFVGQPELAFTLVPTSQYVVDQDFQIQLDELIHDIFHRTVTNVTLSSLGRFTEAYERVKLVDSKSELAAPPKPPRIQDRRLLTKVIKGSSLGAREFGCTDPYCIVTMDQPAQRHTTSVVKNTINPFWDEHFLFDLTNSSQEITFELFDRDKPPEDDFLGCCSLKVDDLRRHPTVRQIIPLVGRPNKTDKVTGSITVEFLFMEPAEAQQYELDENLSPRRKIETSRTMLPGGTRVTTTTTTTEKPRDMKLDNTASQESPSKVEKRERSRRSESPSPYTDRKGSRGRERVSSASQDETPPQILVSTDNTATSKDQSPPGGLKDKRSASPSPRRNRFKFWGRSHTYSEPADIPIIKGPEDTDEGFLTSNPNDTLTSQSSTEKSPSDNVKKHKSFARGLKKRFMRSKDKKPRSHSVERSSGIREDNLLKPPGHYSNKSQSTENLQHLDDSTLSKSKTLGGSIRRLFQWRKKSHSSIHGDGDASRDSSLSRSYVRGDGSDISRESTPPISHRGSLQ